MNQNEKAALREILAQRESMYRLLARLYKTEADKDLLDGLGAAGFPEEDGGLGEGSGSSRTGSGTRSPRIP